MRSRPRMGLTRGRGRSEGINGEEDFGRDHEGSLIDVSAGIAQAIEDLESAVAYGRQLRGVRPGPVVLAGQSRGGFLAMHCAGLKPGEVMGVVNFSAGTPTDRLLHPTTRTPAAARPTRSRNSGCMQITTASTRKP